MKKLYIILLACIVLSCSKEMEVNEPKFEVTTKKLTYKVGEAINFNFTGRVENITFYSGLPGADYTFKDRTELQGGTPQISLNTQYGGGGTQINSLKLMVTTELTALTKEAVIAADWTDITSRATITTNTTVVPSGTMNLSDIAKPGKPLYFALKFVGAQDPTKAAGNWIIPAFNASTLLTDGTILPIANLQNAGWLAFSIKNDANSWTARGNPIADLVVIGGGPNAPESEDWFITKPLFFTKVAPDKGLAIQYISSNTLSSYKFAGYTQPGKYKAAFVASNANADGQKSIVRQIEITVTP
jgi:hypothetical protein